MISFRQLCILAMLCVRLPAMARDYRISSAAALDKLSLKAGDRVILTGQNWSDQRLVVKGEGSQQAPIVLTAEKPGQVLLTGHSTLLLDGSWLIADGLYFANGYSLKEDVVAFSPRSANCRLTNTAIVDYNAPDKKTDYRWVSLYGSHNRVDHCFLKGKTHQGPTMVVWLSETPNYHRIDHNYFGPRPDLGVNGGETIRIGTSTWSMYDSYTTVEDNIFDACNGEMEVVSNKSCHNTICRNLFYECVGTLTLRHGNFAAVYGNYFIGNQIEGTGGIRIIGENHRVYNNYLEGLRGTGLKAAISIMDALPSPPLNGYWQVKQAQVVANTIVNCTEAFNIGAGKNEQRNIPPAGGHMANNVVVNAGRLLVLTDEAQQTVMEGNIAYSAAGYAPQAGFRMIDPQLQQDAQGIYIPAAGSVVKGAFTGNYGFVQDDITGRSRTGEKDAGGQQLTGKPAHGFIPEQTGPSWMTMRSAFPVKKQDK